MQGTLFDIGWPAQSVASNSTVMNNAINVFAPPGTSRLAWPDPSFLPAREEEPCYLDAARVWRCAARGEHIVFVGDSITRYQFLALALSFHRATVMDDTIAPSPVIEHEWRHWAPFFRGTTAANARCDCHRSRRAASLQTSNTPNSVHSNRSASSPIVDRFSVQQHFNVIENRYFWLSGDDDTQQPLLNLTFFNLLAPTTPVTGTWLPGDTNETLRSPHAEYSPRWSYPLREFLSKVVSKLQPKPTVLILNTGQWGALEASDATLIASAAATAVPRVLWKTTTAARPRRSGRRSRRLLGGWRSTDVTARRAFKEVFDAARLTSTLSTRDYWDQVGLTRRIPC